VTNMEKIFGVEDKTYVFGPVGVITQSKDAAAAEGD